MNNQGSNHNNFKINMNEPLSSFINIFAPKELNNNNQVNDKCEQNNLDLEHGERNANMYNNSNYYFHDANNNDADPGLLISNPSFGLMRDAFSNLLNQTRNNNYLEGQNSNFRSQYPNDYNQPINHDIKVMSLMSSRLKETFENIIAVSSFIGLFFSFISFILNFCIKLIQANRIEDFDSSQNFQQIKQTYSNQNRFTDNKFRACDSSVYYSHTFKRWLMDQGRTDQTGRVTWRRAKDLVSDAQFAMPESTQRSSPTAFNSRNINEKNYRNYFQTTDLDQGALGNCWFISAATGIIQNFALFKRVVPFDNSFENSVYTGAFHFRFWIYGTWKDVVVDDYLPVGPDNKLIFSKNRETKNEFWCALLEKAYAKVCGSYETLEGGFTTDALVDMSGGIEECFSLVDIRRGAGSASSSSLKVPDLNTFWNIMTTARSKCSVIGCNIEVSLFELYNFQGFRDQKFCSIFFKIQKGVSSLRNEVRMANGLVQGHAYIVTKAAELELNGRTHRLMRVYNPWGNDVEWNGEWSDRSPIWRLISNQIKEELELKIENGLFFFFTILSKRNSLYLFLYLTRLRR
jgi:hypothetical protein